jgi:hypothetical protein
MPQLNHQVLTRPLKSVVSSSWLYPFKGIYFFAANPSFWPLLGQRLIPLVFVSVVIFGFLFTFAYLPQVAFLALFGHGPGAFLNAAFLVLGEGAVIIALLFEALLVDETLVDVFDAVTRPFTLHLSDLTNQLRSSSHKVSSNSSPQLVSSTTTHLTLSKCLVGPPPPPSTRHSPSVKSWSSSCSYLCTSFHTSARLLSLLLRGQGPARLRIGAISSLGV